MSEPRPPIRIVIADDHPLVRDGLRKLLEGQSGFRVIGEAADGVEALERAQALEPDVLLLDLAMPCMNGLEVLSALAGSTTGVRTVLLTAAIEGEETVRALRLGARGVVLKESATEQLYLCIRAVMRGEFWVGREHVGDLLQALRQLERASSPPPPAATLTARERQVIAAVVEGASNREIGKMIGVSEQTVKNRLSSIFDKLGVSSRLELALYAMHHGLLADGERSAGTPQRTS